jgi:hypothetical protein
MTAPDSEREVPMIDDNELAVLPDQTTDDTDEGWGDRHGEDELASEERLLADRPPHWGH